LCDLKPHAKFQNTTITPSEIKGSEAERKKKREREREKTPLIVLRQPDLEIILALLGA
jgi:hypothetical protein